MNTHEEHHSLAGAPRLNDTAPSPASSSPATTIKLNVWGPRVAVQGMTAAIEGV